MKAARCIVFPRWRVGSRAGRTGGPFRAALPLKNQTGASADRSFSRGPNRNAGGELRRRRNPHNLDLKRFNFDSSL